MTSPSLAIQMVDKTSRVDSTIQNSNEINKQSATHVSTWYGRTVKTVKDNVESFFAKIVFVAQKSLNALGNLGTDPNSIATIFRRLNGQVFDAIEQLAKIPGFFGKLRGSSGSFVGYVDALQVTGDVKYFAKGEHKTDNSITVASRISLFVANAGWTLMWLQEMSFLSLSKAAAALGEVRLFSFVPKVISCIPYVRDVSSLQRFASTVGEIRVFGIFNKLSMGVVAGRALTLFYVFSAVDAIRSLVNADNSKAVKIQAGLDLSYYIAELTLDALLTVGVTNVLGLGAVGAISIVAAVTGLVYKTYK